MEDIYLSSLARHDKIKEYQLCINTVVKQFLKHLTTAEIKQRDQEFKRWINSYSKEKHFGEDWREFHCRHLYKLQIRSTIQAFQQLLTDEPNSIRRLKRTCSVVSIGCGPGSHIAAIAMILRTGLGVRHPISIRGIDKSGEWRKYVEVLNNVHYQTPRSKSSITFVNLHIDAKSIDLIERADLCIISISDANIQTTQFWQEMKSKFRFVVALDHKSRMPVRLMNCLGLVLHEYGLKDTARFFCTKTLTDEESDDEDDACYDDAFETEQFELERAMVKNERKKVKQKAAARDVNGEEDWSFRRKRGKKKRKHGSDDDNDFW